MTTTYTVREVPGEENTTAGRCTHAVIGRQNLVAAREELRSSGYTLMIGQSWDYHAQMAARDVGSLIVAKHAGRTSYRNLGAEELAKYTAFLAENPVREAYIEKCREHALECLNRIHGTADIGDLRVLRWCISDSAVDRIHFVSRGFYDVRVVPVTLKDES